MASSSPSASGSASDVPWVEKHRPIYLKDIIGNKAAVSRLKDIARDGNMPNLILSGPSGVGKTTSILALAHELLGPNYKEAVLELDASDERGIDAVIKEITMFAQKKVMLRPGRFKMIILDKVDSVADEAQEALSQTMKVYSTSARFAFTCDVSTDIIEPIWRKCTRVFFSRLSDGEIWNRLSVVCVKEKVRADRELKGPMAIIVLAGGDMRRALDILQATVRAHGGVNRKNVIKAYKQFRSQHVMKSTTCDETNGENDDDDEIEALQEMDISALFIHFPPNCQKEEKRGFPFSVSVEALSLFDLESGRKMASSSPSGSDSASDLPWVEKHRPIYLKDIVGNEAAISRLKDIARDGNMPNLIISGPSGTGKTTSILALANELLGPNYKEAVLELDALDKRGIDAVINEITMFAQKKVMLSPGRFKIIVLDKVDRVTARAQEALSRTMEMCSNSARFAFTCYISRNIIEPIPSRCDLVLFSKLSYIEIHEILSVIADKEKVPPDPEKKDAIEVINHFAHGNMRWALIILQATFSGFRFVNVKNVTEAFKQLHSPHEGKNDDTSRGGDRGPLAVLARDNSCWNDAAERFFSSLTFSQLRVQAGAELMKSSIRERANCVAQSMDQMFALLKETVVQTEQFRCDAVRFRKERDEENERATKLAFENEELNRHILNEQSITRRWKDRLLNKQNMTRKLKVRFLSETRKWKIRFLNEQKMTKRWKVRFADVKVERRKKAKKAKKQLKLLEMVQVAKDAELQRKVSELGMAQAAKEKAELQRKVAEFEKAQAVTEKAELLRKVSELEMVQAAKEKAELQLKVAELEKAQAVIENAKLQQKVTELESIQTAAEQLLALEPPPLQ